MQPVHDTNTYTSQPTTPNLPIDISLPPAGNTSTTTLLMLTFCVWLLRQQPTRH